MCFFVALTANPLMHKTGADVSAQQERYMATHMLDYKSIEGRWTACGRFFADKAPLPRGVTVAESDADVSCQPCLRTERLKVARVRRHGGPRPLSAEAIANDCP